jgi:hypothetical protein
MDNQSIQSHIKKEKSHRQPTYKYIIGNLFSNFYIPSKKSIILIAILFCVNVIFSHIKFEFFTFDYFIKSESNEYQNLIAILSGLGVIIISLVILVAECLRDDYDTDRARVLLKESYIYPLSSLWILSFFNFIFGKVNFLSIIPIITIGIFSFISLIKVIGVLLNKAEFIKKRNDLFKERLKQNIELAFDERIGNNFLLSKLNETEIKLVYTPFHQLENENEFYIIKSDQVGFIYDVNLDKLKLISDIIETEARKNGFTFSKDFEPKIQIENDLITNTIIRHPTAIDKERFLLKRFYEQVGNKKPNLIAFKKKLINDQVQLKKIFSLAKSAFIIKPIENITLEMRYEIAGLKDQLLEAINKSQFRKIDELANLYVGLLEGFLESLKDYGGGYSFEQARKERNSFISEWEQIRWLSNDLRDLFEAVFKMEDKKIILEIISLPREIAKLAIENHDQYIFQVFLDFHLLIYTHAKKLKDIELKSFFIDLSWRYLRELSEFYIEYHLRSQSKDIKEKNILKDFAIYFFNVFQLLLKSAFTLDDKDSFDDFLEVTINLFQYFKPSDSKFNSNMLNIYLNDLSKTQQEEVIEKQNQLEKQMQLENLEKEINSRRQQMLYGVASWILFVILNNEKKESKDLLNIISAKLPTNTIKFTELFLDLYSEEVKDFWGWDFWQPIPEREAVFVNTDKNLVNFYAVKNLKNIGLISDDKILKIVLPHNRILRNLAEEDSDLLIFLKELKNTPKMLEGILNSEQIEKIDAFIQILKNAQSEQNDYEKKVLREISISEVKKLEFNREFIKSFEDHSSIRQIFNYLSLFKDESLSPPNNNLKRFGINVVDDKAVFVNDWFISYGGWGSHYGEQFAIIENNKIILDLITHTVDQKDISIEELLSSQKNYQDLFFLSIRSPFPENTEMNRHFVPKWRINNQSNEDPNLIGYFETNENLIPIYSCNECSNPPNLFLLNRKKLGVLRQHSPLEKNEEEPLREKCFYINVQAFSEQSELTNKFLMKPPEWLLKYGEKEKQKEYLYELVLIHIFEKLEFEMDKSFLGFKLKKEKK